MILPEKINIELSKSEALILFELVSRFSDVEKLEIKNPAEERVLWAVCSRLESILAAPLQKDYADLLAKASEDIMRGELH